jgi:hypothetical protein
VRKASGKTTVAAALGIGVALLIGLSSATGQSGTVTTVCPPGHQNDSYCTTSTVLPTTPSVSVPSVGSLGSPSNPVAGSAPRRPPGCSFEPFVLYFSDGSVLVNGTCDDDFLQAPSDGRGFVYAYTGNDRLVGSPNTDLMIGGPGNDKLAGGASKDRLDGEGGSDTLSGDDGDDTLRGKDGNDTLGGGPGKDRMNGGDGNDKLLGQAGADLITGHEGNDTLAGGPGANRVIAGPGRDAVSGGPNPERIDTRDGQVDRVRCRNRRDALRVDRRDRLSGTCAR